MFQSFSLRVHMTRYQITFVFLHYALVLLLMYILWSKGKYHPEYFVLIRQNLMIKAYLVKLSLAQTGSVLVLISRVPLLPRFQVPQFLSFCFPVYSFHFTVSGFHFFIVLIFLLSLFFCICFCFLFSLLFLLLHELLLCCCCRLCFWSEI